MTSGTATTRTTDTTGTTTDGPLVEAACRCVSRWGIRKTSLDDIAREAGVSRATVYREFPGGKDRLVEALVQHEARRVFHDLDVRLGTADTLEDLLVVGIGAFLCLPHDDGLVRTVFALEPELVLPHFAFDRLDRVFDISEALCRPHLARFLADADVRPAVEIVTRTLVTFTVHPAPWLDPRDEPSVRHLVRTYLLPAVSPTQEHR